MKLTVSPFFGKVAGKVSGQIVQNNRSGLSGRLFKPSQKKPTHISSPFNNNFNSIAVRWSGLSGAIKASWQAVVHLFTFFDKFNNPYTPSAYQLYQWCCNNLLSIGLSLTDTPPTILFVDDAGAAWDSVSISSLSFVVEALNHSGINIEMSVYVSKWLPASAQRTSFKFKMFYHCNSLSVSFLNLYSQLLTFDNMLATIPGCFAVRTILTDVNTGWQCLEQSEVVLINP